MKRFRTRQIALFHQANDWIYGGHIYNSTGLSSPISSWGPLPVPGLEGFAFLEHRDFAVKPPDFKQWLLQIW